MSAALPDPRPVTAGPVPENDPLESAAGRETARVDPQPRVSALDGLRGWAALVVVFNHAFNASLAWYTPPGITPWPTWSARWFIVQTPLHLIWAGPEMVMVFFVLSGYVLTLPALRRGENWFRISYYPRRLVRLYLPAWAAILFAALLHYLPARVPQPGAANWLNAFAVPATVTNGVQTAVLVGPAAALNPYTSVLWSMRWEVIFSLMLPFVVGGALATRRRPGLAVAAAGLCFYLICRTPDNGAFLQNCVRFLPIFVLGSLMAVHVEPGPRAAVAATRAADGPAPTPATVLRGGPPGRLLRGVGSAVAISACVALLTIGYWTVNEDLGSTMGWLEAGSIAGACLAVLLALRSRPVAAAMRAAPSQWLGHRSYSLYLIHQPIVLSLAFAFHGHVSVFVLAGISLPVSLIAADALWRLVERPTIVLSRRIGLGTNRLLDQFGTARVTRLAD